MSNNFFKELIWGPTPKNKEETTRFLNSTNAEKSAINFYNIIEGDPEVNNFLSPLKQVLQLKWMSAEAHAKKFGIKNDAFTFSDPRSAYKEKALKWVLKSTVKAVKGAPKAIKPAYQSIKSGLKFTGDSLKNQYNKDFNSFYVIDGSEPPNLMPYLLQTDRLVPDATGKLEGYVEKTNQNYLLKENFTNPTRGVDNGLSNNVNQLIQTNQNLSSFNFSDMDMSWLRSLNASIGGSNVWNSIRGMFSNVLVASAGAVVGGAMGGTLSTSPSGHGYTGTPPVFKTWDCYGTIISNYHNGGVVPGRGEVPAILKGGETVRTKAQEEELKQMLYDRYVGDFIPTVCGAATQPPRQQQQAAAEQSEIPIHRQITRDDENFILNLFSDAIDKNRAGLRTKIQGI